MFKQPKLLALSLCLLTFCCSNQARADVKNYQDYRAPRVSDEIAHMQDFHLQNAEDKLRKEQYSYAWGDFAYLLCQMPNHHIALRDMQELALKLNKQDELIKYFENGIKTFPEDKALYALYGQFLSMLGKHDLSKAMLDKASDMQPAKVSN